MSAQEQMRKMLDELMGTKRDGVAREEVSFTDYSVCRAYLLGLCPYDLFSNTKLDLGSCRKYHSPALKADFEAESKVKKFNFEYDQLDLLLNFVAECDQKILQNKKRLENNKDEFDNSPEASAVHALNEQIGKKLAEAEARGAEGDVDGSVAIMKEVDELRLEKRKAEDIYRDSVPSSTTQQQKLRVCEVCGAFLSLSDNDRRLSDHFGGKLHLGFLSIRKRAAQLQTTLDLTALNIDRERRAPPPSKRDRSRSPLRTKDTSRDRRSPRDHGSDRGYDRHSRDRGHRDRHDSRRHSHSRDRH